MGPPAVQVGTDLTVGAGRGGACGLLRTAAAARGWRGGGDGRAAHGGPAVGRGGLRVLATHGSGEGVKRPGAALGPGLCQSGIHPQGSMDRHHWMTNRKPPYGGRPGTKGWSIYAAHRFLALLAAQAPAAQSWSVEPARDREAAYSCRTPIRRGAGHDRGKPRPRPRSTRRRQRPQRRRLMRLLRICSAEWEISHGANPGG